MQRLSRVYHALAEIVYDTPFADVPGVRSAHATISRWLERASRATTDGTVLTEYHGTPIVVDPSDHVGGNIYRKGSFEPLVRDAIETLLEPGDTAIDVGSHVGHHGVTMRDRIGPDGSLFLFEPHPKNSALIERTIDHNGWQNIELVRKGLYDEEAVFPLVENEVNTGAVQLETDEERAAVETYEIETMRLSEFLEDRAIDRVDLMKIDVEGAESNIITDIADELDRFKAIIMELHRDKLSETVYQRTFDILDEHGTVATITGDSLDSLSELDRMEDRDNIRWTRT